MTAQTNGSLWHNGREATSGAAGLRRRRRPGIAECADFIRRRPDSPSVAKAAARVARILAKRFPADRFEWNLTAGEVERQLVLAVGSGRPLVAAFAQRKNGPLDAWTWEVHLVEIAGRAARIDNLVPTLHAPGQGTFRASGGALREPLWIAPFGEAMHEWSCRGALWRASRATLTYVGCHGEKNAYLRVRPLTVFLD